MAITEARCSFNGLLRVARVFYQTTKELSLSHEIETLNV